MWDSPSNGLIVYPDPAKEQLALFLRETNISALKKAVYEYEEWYVSGDTSHLVNSLCNELWKKFGLKTGGELADFKERLSMYDAICREIARRFTFKDLLDEVE